MRNVAAVLLLFAFISRAQTQDHDEVQTDKVTENKKCDQPDVLEKLKELRDVMVEQKVQVQNLQNQIEQLNIENNALKMRLISSEYAVASIKEENASRPKVAFQAGSGYQGEHGPFNADVILAFSNVLTNVGNAYSPNTGVFRAPVRGVYHFSMSVFGLTNWIGVKFFKNGQSVFAMYDAPRGTHETVSRSVTMSLNSGDEVYSKLSAKNQIYDDGNMYNSFSGFLLFQI
ncbi:cerebellin 17 isoform X1 [Trichomycterus rosablanca]|uniref:cerebellin 17 isoform X1 n=1 Tax=Trichomycterus rosablanca TaxID=2290929 RepID=UPI002F3574B1